MDRRIARSWAKLFSLGEDEEVVQALTAKCRLREFADREVLIEQADDDKSVFLIIAGTAKVVRWTEDGDDTWLSSLAEGDLVGETAALIETPRTSSVIANGRVHAAQLEGRDFIELLEALPALSLALNRLLAMRVKRTSDQLVAQVREDVADRLHAYLASISDPLPGEPSRAIVRKPPSVKEMSEHIHASREAASRNLGRLKDRLVVQELPNKDLMVIKPRP